MRNKVPLRSSSLDKVSKDFQQRTISTISKWSYISNIVSKTNKLVLKQIKIKPQTGSQKLVRRTMRLVEYCTNWSKSNQHLV